jgi:hypothetical protein
MTAQERFAAIFENRRKLAGASSAMDWLVATVGDLQDQVDGLKKEKTALKRRVTRLEKK